FNTPGANKAIWALGLRNPFTFAVQPGTGRLFINDVGETSWEEIDDGVAGSNYGWPNAEGFSNNPSFRNPLFAYPHGSGTQAGDAIAGGPSTTQAVWRSGSGNNAAYYSSASSNNWIRVLPPATASVRDSPANLPGPCLSNP